VPISARLRTAEEGGRSAAGREPGPASDSLSDAPISPQTVNDYRGLIERKLKAGLGKLRLAQLDTQRLDRFYGPGRPVCWTRWMAWLREETPSLR
jgi:hypothetical protein